MRTFIPHQTTPTLTYAAIGDYTQWGLGNGQGQGCTACTDATDLLMSTPFSIT